MGGDRVNFFVGQAGRDDGWAEWVAWQLIDAGYNVALDVRAWAVGRNFVRAINDGAVRAGAGACLAGSAGCVLPDRRHGWSAQWEPK